MHSRLAFHAQCCNAALVLMTLFNTLFTSLPATAHGPTRARSAKRGSATVVASPAFTLMALGSVGLGSFHVDPVDRYMSCATPHWWSMIVRRQTVGWCTW